MGRKSFKAGALTAPLPPVMVTVGKGDEVNVLTIAWTGILSTVPPRTYISVRPERHSYKLLREHGEFVINLPRASMARTVDYVGIYTGKKVNKLAECGLTVIPSEKVATPTLAECPFALECRVCEVIPMGTHDVFIADIVSVSADESILDESGRICFDRADLLAYAHGEYFALGEKLGSFGFSTKKESKGKRNKKRASASAAAAQDGQAREDGAEELRGGRSTDAVTEEPREGHSGDSHSEQKRPFYLTAPRGRGNKKSGSKRGKRK